MKWRKRFRNPARARQLAIESIRLGKSISFNRYSAISYELAMSDAPKNTKLVRQKFKFDFGWHESRSDGANRSIEHLKLPMNTIAARRNSFLYGALIVSAFAVGSWFAFETIPQTSVTRDPRLPSCPQELNENQQASISEIKSNIRKSQNSDFVITDEYDFGGVTTLIVESVCSAEVNTFQIQGSEGTKAKWTQLD